MPVETILLLLHGNKEYELLFEVLIKHASKKQHYLCLL